MQNLRQPIKYVAIAILVCSLASLLWPIQNARAAFGIDPKITQVKTANNPAVYYLDHSRGLKKSYVNEAAYLSYGNNWGDIKILDQSSIDKWPDLRLVTSKNTSSIYYIARNKKALIKPDDFNAFGIKSSQAINIHPVDLASYDLASYEEIGLAPKDLSTKLSSASPNDNFIAANTKNNLLGVFDFGSSVDQTKISSISFSLDGIFNANILTKIYLTNEADWEIETASDKNGREIKFRFNPSLVIDKGQSQSLKLFADLGACASCVNNTIQASLKSINGAQVMSILGKNTPVQAATFKIISGQGNLAQYRIEEKYTNLANVVVGSKDQIIGKFRITETSGNEDLILREIRFQNNGSAQPSDLDNLKLKTGSQIIALTPNFTNDNLIVFKPTKIIPKDRSEDLIVTADIKNGNAKNINLEFKDAKIIGSDYGFGLNISSYTPLPESILISRETLSVLATNLKANKTVFAKQAGVIIGNFEIRNIDQEIALAGIDISLEKNNEAPDLDKLIYAVNYNTGEVYASVKGSKLSNGASNLKLNNLPLGAKKDIALSLITDIPATARNGDNYKVTLNRLYYKGENGGYYAEEVNAPASILTINKSDLYLYSGRDASYAYTKGQNNLKIASFLVEISSVEDVVINSAALAKGDNTSGNITYENGFANLKLYIGGSACGTIARPRSGNYEFTNCAKKLTAGRSYSIEAYIDTSEDLKANSTQLMLADIFASGYSSGFPSAVNFPQAPETQKIQGAITTFRDVALSLTAGAGGAISSSVDNNVAGSFTLKNTGDENIAVTQIIITTDEAGFSSNLGFNDLSIIQRYATGNQERGRVANPVGGSNKLGLSGITLEPNEEFIFDVEIDADASVSAGSFQMYLHGIVAKGASSGIDAKISGVPSANITVTVN